MNYDVEREEQPIVKIPALLPWAFRAGAIALSSGEGRPRAMEWCTI
jgi:hypothetical protein